MNAKSDYCINCCVNADACVSVVYSDAGLVDWLRVSMIFLLYFMSATFLLLKQKNLIAEIRFYFKVGRYILASHCFTSLIFLSIYFDVSQQVITYSITYMYILFHSIRYMKSWLYYKYGTCLNKLQQNGTITPYVTLACHWPVISELKNYYFKLLSSSYHNCTICIGMIKLQQMSLCCCILYDHIHDQWPWSTRKTLLVKRLDDGEIPVYHTCSHVHYFKKLAPPN